MKINLFLLLFSLLSFSQIYGDMTSRSITQYIYETWGEKEGLPQNSVISINQTPDNYLWLGTQEGLVRFDGKEFVVYNSYNTPEIKNNEINTIVVDKNGDIYFGSVGVVMRSRKGKFKRVSFFDDKTVTRLLFDRSGNLWVGTDKEGMFIKKKSGEIERFTVKDGLKHNAITNFFEDRDGTIWISTQGGISFLRKGKIDNFEIAGSGFFRTVYRDSKGVLWLGKMNGLLSFKDGKLTKYGKNDGIYANNISAIIEDYNKNIWFASEGGGVVRYAKGEFEALPAGHSFANALSSFFFEDRERGLWVGTLTNGLNRIREGKFSVFSEFENFGKGTFTSVSSDSSGKIIGGTIDGELIVYDRKSKVKKYSKKNGYSGGIIYSVLGDSDGNVWIGTRKNGLYLFKDGDFTQIELDSGIEGQKAIRTLFEDSRKRLWIITKGRYIYLREKGEFKKIKISDKMFNDVTLAINEDKSGNIWIGTLYNGVFRFDGREFRATGKRDGIDAVKVIAIYTDRAGTVWFFAPGRGIYRYLEGTFSFIEQRKGLPSSSLIGMVEDNYGNMWITANNGLMKVGIGDLNSVADGKTDAVEPEFFDYSDGMKTKEFVGGIGPAIMKDKDGVLWFSTVKGLLRVDPRNIALNKFKPPVYIEKFLTNGAQHGLKDSDEIITLKSSTDKFQFNFTALSFLVPSKIKFKYMLEGYEKEWVTIENKRYASYMNLKPGRYTFRVRASNNDGLWSEDEASVSFYLKPKFYQTIWFYLVVLTLFLATVFIALRIRTGRFERRSKKLAIMVLEKTKELRNSLMNMEKANKLMMDELNLAAGLQRSLIKLPDAEDDRFKIASFYQPSKSLGGDFYDVVRLDRDRYRLIIADVSGHGVSAALISSMLKAYFRIYAVGHASPSAFIHKLNNELSSVIKTGEYATCVYTIMDLRKMKMSFSFAGHPPVIKTESNKTLKEIQCNSFMAGVFRDREYEDIEIDIKRGERFFFYTDGIIEAGVSQGKMDGDRIFREFLSENSDKTIEELVSSAEAYISIETGVTEFEDDISILALEVC